MKTKTVACGRKFSKQLQASEAYFKVSEKQKRIPDNIPDELVRDVKKTLSDEVVIAQKILYKIKKAFTAMSYIVDDDINVNIDVATKVFSPRRPYGMEISTIITASAPMKGIRRYVKVGMLFTIDNTLPFDSEGRLLNNYKDYHYTEPKCNSGYLKGSRMKAIYFIGRKHGYTDSTFHHEPSTNDIINFITLNKNVWKKIISNDEIYKRYIKVYH